MEIYETEMRNDSILFNELIESENETNGVKLNGNDRE